MRVVINGMNNVVTVTSGGVESINIFIKNIPYI